MWPVIKLVPLIGWNYSIQTGEKISTNKFIAGHKGYNPAYA